MPIDMSPCLLTCGPQISGPARSLHTFFFFLLTYFIQSRYTLLQSNTFLLGGFKLPPTIRVR